MSTNRKDNLNDIIKRQEAILSSLKDEAQSIDNDSIIKQNESLSSEIKEIKMGGIGAARICSFKGKRAVKR